MAIDADDMADAAYWKAKYESLQAARPEVLRSDVLESAADMCIRMARSESSVGHDKEASILEAAAFGIRALKGQREPQPCGEATQVTAIMP